MKEIQSDTQTTSLESNRVSQFQFDELNIDPQGDYFQTEVAALFCAYGQKGATTHDEEENAADHHILQNAAGQQAWRRKRAAFIEKLHICMETGIEKFALCMVQSYWEDVSIF